MNHYLASFFSLKKFKYKDISFTSLWDNRSTFSEFTSLQRGCKLINSHVGKYSRVCINTRVLNTTIGNFTLIARDSIIAPGAHPTNFLSPHSIFYKKNRWKWHDDWCKDIGFYEEDRPVKIGNGVWLGINCIVMDGVTIGDGAIVAAGSIVTKDVPPYSVVGGIPAKVIKYRFPKEMIDRLLEIQWWNLPDEELNKVVDLFHIENPTIQDLDKYFPRN